MCQTLTYLQTSTLVLLKNNIAQVHTLLNQLHDSLLGTSMVHISLELLFAQGES